MKCKKPKGGVKKWDLENVFLLLEMESDVIYQYTFRSLSHQNQNLS